MASNLRLNIDILISADISEQHKILQKTQVIVYLKSTRWLLNNKAVVNYQYGITRTKGNFEKMISLIDPTQQSDVL